MRGASFGIPGEQVDGMDVLAVRDAGARAAERVRSGAGPIILEMKTYRYRGHSMSDPAKYRTREEVDAMRSQRDPIENIRPLLDGAGVTADRIKAVDDEVKSVVAEAVQFAQSSPEPDPSELYTDVYLEA
jgi:pyruvate dehydrogenase E1 component alpha subunit